MFEKWLVLYILFFAHSALSYLTFRNVMVTCEPGSPSEDTSPFGTVITANGLHSHLPNDDSCYKISIDHANLPILYEDSLSDISGVHFLLLENNNIEQIRPGALQNMSVDEVISLKSNKLTEVRRGVFNSVRVPVLDLSFNAISSINPAAFDNMTILESIHLHNNRLTRIYSSWFANCPRLRQIDLHNNQIREVPAHAFGNLVFRKFNGPVIDLSKNSIWSVHRDAFRETNSTISFLTLANNKINVLDQWWLVGIEVQTLDISNNGLRCLTNGLPKSHSTVFVEGNPWDCNCLQKMNQKMTNAFGRIEADASFRKCNILTN